MSRPLLPPPALFFLSIVAMEALAILVPDSRMFGPPVTLVGIPLIFAGVWLHMAATRLFRRRQTTLATLASPTTLVTDGPFSFTRNPMYLAGALILVGVGIFLGSGPSLLVPLLFGYLAHHWYIRPEEELLRVELGEEYEGYAAQVRSWL